RKGAIASCRCDAKRSCCWRAEVGRLKGEMVSESVDAAFGMLAQTEQPHGGRTVEELVTGLIRPMLKTWLDDNLPGLVERLVRGSASWLLVTAMRDADRMAEQWGHDVAITRLAYMKRHLERNSEAEIEPAARAKGLAAEQEDKVTLLRDTPAEPPRDLNPQEAEIWQATVDGLKAQDLVRDFDDRWRGLEVVTSEICLRTAAPRVRPA